MTYLNSDFPTTRTNRPLPQGVPGSVELQITQAEFFDAKRGVMRQQWQAFVLPEGSTRLGDYIKVVVNFHHLMSPQENETWLVTLDHMAPKAEIIFATAIERVTKTPPAEPEESPEPAAQPKPKKVAAAEPERGYLALMQDKLRQLRERFGR